MYTISHFNFENLIIVLIVAIIGVVSLRQIMTNRRIKHFDQDYLEKKRSNMSEKQYLRYLRKNIGYLEADIIINKERGEDFSESKQKQDFLKVELRKYDPLGRI